MEAISGTSNNIARATEVQTQVASTIASNISELTAIAESTSEGAAMTSSSVNEFRSMSKQLQDLVGQFSLDEEVSRSSSEEFRTFIAEQEEGLTEVPAPEPEQLSSAKNRDEVFF